MREYVPDYYSEFSCIADQCRHSCCKGWEIDVDEDSLKYYATLPESWKARIASNIEVDDSGAHFCLTEEERCPFLKENGLCEMILGLGEKALCQICTDHPRFRNFFPDRTETGLGLCCEAVGRLILGREEKTRLIELTNAGKPEAPENPILTLRAELIAAMQDRSLPVRKRAEKIASAFGSGKLQPASQYCEFLLSLEQMDEEWTDLLKKLCASHPFPDAPAETELTEIAFEQLAVYLLFRHLPDADCPEEAYDQIFFVLFALDLIQKLCAMKEMQPGTLTLEDIVEVCRLFSSEIEYSDENKELIIEKLTEQKL